MYDPKDARGVPVSGGIPPIVTISAIVGLIVIIFMLGIVIGWSYYGHVWPSTDSTHIKLGQTAAPSSLTLMRTIVLD